MRIKRPKKTDPITVENIDRHPMSLLPSIHGNGYSVTGPCSSCQACGSRRVVITNAYIGSYFYDWYMHHQNDAIIVDETDYGCLEWSNTLCLSCYEFDYYIVGRFVACIDELD